MGDGSKLVRIMHEAAKPKESERVGIVIGEVISISPIKIKCDKLFLSETFLILSPFCRELKLNVFAHTHIISVSSGSSHNHTVGELTTSDESSHTHPASSGEGLTSVTVWRGLQIGDKVRMLKCGGGQTYYVLERVE